MMANGMLAGLVAITAPCAFVAPWAAAVIGGVAGVLVIESVFFVERKVKVDDPVGAISVHGVNGFFGVLAVGIFANGSYGAGWNGSDSTGVEGIIKGDWGQFGAQLLGAAVIATVIFGIAFAFFKIQNAITKGGIRPTPEDELAGLDLPEMGVLAYPEFQGSCSGIGTAPRRGAGRQGTPSTRELQAGSGSGLDPGPEPTGASRAAAVSGPPAGAAAPFPGPADLEGLGPLRAAGLRAARAALHPGRDGRRHRHARRRGRRPAVGQLALARGVRDLPQHAVRPEFGPWSTSTSTCTASSTTG